MNGDYIASPLCDSGEHQTTDDEAYCEWVSVDLLRRRHFRITRSTRCGLQLAAETKLDITKSKRQRQRQHTYTQKHNCFIATFQPLLSKLAEVRVAKWQEHWEATESNLKKYDTHTKEQLPSGHTLPWRTWRKANRVRSGQAATPATNNIMWGYREARINFQTEIINGELSCAKRYSVT